MVELKFAIKLALALGGVICLGRPLHAQATTNISVCMTTDGTISCNAQYGDWPGSYPEEALQDFAASCVLKECEGETCHQPNLSVSQPVSFSEWMLARVALTPAPSGVPGHYYDLLNSFICSQLIWCDVCKLYADRPGHPAGRYCAISATDVQPLPQYSQLTGCTGP